MLMDKLLYEFAKINTFPIGKHQQWGKKRFNQTKKKKTSEKFLFSEYRHFMLEP